MAPWAPSTVRAQACEQLGLPSKRRPARKAAGRSVAFPSTETARPSGPTAVTSTTVPLRNDCRKIGHALAQKVHDGDRWVAASALRLGVPLVSHDDVFVGAPSLELMSLRENRGGPGQR